MKLKKGSLPAIILIVIFLLSLGALVTLFRNKVSFFNFAASNKITVVRGLANDFTADLVLGHPDFNQAIPGTVSSYKVAHPGGVYVDRSTSPNRVYVYDGLNSRMLGYKSLGSCEKASTIACSSDSDCVTGDVCKIDRIGPGGSRKPDIIIGQPNDSSSACNGDGTNNTSTDFPLPSASSLCGVPPSEPSPAEGGSWESPVTDSDGNLYLADFYNNRVLKYNDPFKTDQVADDVWGQPDFTSYRCNHGDQISNSGFCFINYAPTKPVTGSVDLDSKGNLWVVDGGNNRVLRFPKTAKGIQKEADLVLGQPNFTSKNPGADLNKLNAPTAVRVHPNGTVYVADAQNGRVLYFPNPATNAVAKLLSGTSAKAGGLEFDLKKDSDPNSGGIWVVETDNHQIALFSETGQVKKVLIKDTYRPNGQNEGQTNCPTQNEADLCSLEAPRGSLGITKDGDVIASGSYSESALYFKHPIPTPTPGTSYQGISRFFAPPFTANAFDDKSFLGPRGLATTKDQLIVSDHARILFWNNLTPTGTNIDRPADGVLMAPNATTYLDPYFFRIYASDKSLWVIYQNSLLRFTLPLKNGQAYAQRLPFSDLRYINNNQSVGFETYASDVFASPDDEYLWLTFPYQNRVARVIIPPDYQGDYKIDTLIGGASIPKNNHVWHQTCPANLDQPCAPGSVVEDTNGNLAVSDYYIENEGTGDLFFFKEDLFPFDDGLKVISIKNSFKKYPQVYGWQPAFGPNNEMVIGTAAFFDGRLRFPTVYADPTGPAAKLRPISTLTDNYTQALTAHFDSQWNLFITDMNRGRVLGYLTPIKKLKGERPIAQFSYTPHSGKSPLTVSFTNTSPLLKKEKLKSVWDFGDGTRSTETNPIHKFIANRRTSGVTFSVRLVVTNSKGDSSIPKIKVVTVNTNQ